MGFCAQRMQGRQQDRLGRRRKDQRGDDLKERRRYSGRSFGCGYRLVFVGLDAQVWGG